MRKFFYYLPLFLLILHSCGTINHSLKTKTQLLKDLNIHSFPTKEMYPNYDAVYLSIEEYSKFIVPDSFIPYIRTVYSQSILVFENGDRFSDISIPINEFEELEQIEACTIKNDGTVVSLEPDDFYFVKGSQGESSVYTDERSVHFTFKQIEEDCVLQYMYVKKNTLPILSNHWLVQNTLPILSNKFSIAIPTIFTSPKEMGGRGVKWQYSFYNFKKVDPVVLVEEPSGKNQYEELTTISWELIDIPAFDQEKMMPPILDYIGHLRFTPLGMENWNDVTKWYFEISDLFEIELEEDADQDTIDYVLETLIEPTDSEIQKIRYLYDYVRNIRYESISIGLGGLVPNPPVNVIINGYGDCKDKSTLLVHLLTKLGIDAHRVLVKTSDKGKFITDFINWDFNHMIVKVYPKNRSPFFLDPTTKYHSFPQMPWYCHNTNVLVFESDSTGNIEKTPPISFDGNKSVMNIDVTVNKDGSAKFIVSEKLTGEYEANLRNKFALMSKKEKEESFYESIVDNLLDVKLDSLTHSETDSINSEFTVNYYFSVQDFLKENSDLSMITVDPFKIIDDLNPFKTRERQFPIDFSYAQSIRKIIRIAYSETDLQLRSLPEDLSIGNQYITYRRSFEQEDDSTIMVKDVFIIRDPVIPAEKYQQTKQIMSKIQSKIDEQLILVKQ